MQPTIRARAGKNHHLPRGRLIGALTLFTAILAGCGPSETANPAGASQQLSSQTSASSPQTVAKGTELDASNCAWPNFTDGRVTGFGFNDRNAGYRATPMFTGLPGGHWRFRGRYPYGRWISFESYDRTLSSQHSITGRSIDPDNSRLKSPYLPGGTAKPGDTFTVDMYDLPPSQRDAKARNVLYGGYRSSPAYGGYMREETQSVIYRVYAAPDEIDTFGGMTPPQILWVVDDPATSPFKTPEDACRSLGLANAEYQPWPTIISGLEAINYSVLKPIVVPLAQLMQTPIDPRDPPLPAVLRPSSNGYQNLYFNSQTPYFGVMPNKQVGPLLVIRFKTPSFRRIEDGEQSTGKEQVAYWDWCSTQFLTPLNYTIGCRRDELYQIDQDGYATLVVSTEDERPVINGKPYQDWLPMAGNAGMTVMRTLSPNQSTFPESPMFLPPVFKLGDAEPPADIIGPWAEAQIKQHMGSYYPTMKYCTKAEFEKDRCATSAPRPTAAFAPFFNAFGSAMSAGAGGGTPSPSSLPTSLPGAP